jgi:hypothetical protein
MLPTGVFLVFLLCKLLGAVTWSWWIVFSPLIIWAVLIFVAAVFAALKE